MARKSRNPKRARASNSADLSEFSGQVQIAIRAYERGDLETAAHTAAAILSRQPKHPDALHLLGLSEFQRGDHERAISLIGDALSLSPRNATLHKNLGDALQLSGDLASAEMSLRRAVKLKSDFVEAWNGLGMVRHQLGRYQEAIVAFGKALRFRSDSADIYNNLGISKRTMDQLSDALDCFQQALRLQPDHAEAHSNLGSTLMDLGSHEDKRINLAVQSYQAALQHATERSGIRRNLAYLYRKVVPQWHFPMLNDSVRNDAYDTALRELVKEDDLVLDIGTGSGLLAMMAARADARQVISCESVEAIADKAQEIIAANGFDDRVIVVNKQSDSLQVGEDLPRLADVLVAEIFDTGLIGEGALRSIHHAKQSLLKPKAVIIPRRATVYGALIESESICNLDRVQTAGGFDVSGFNEFSTHPAYLQERLGAHPHRCLSEPFEIFSFDFQAEIPFYRSLTIPVRITQSGAIHAIAFWFSIYLTEEIVLTTAPTDGDGHWQQAIGLLAIQRSVSVGDVCQVVAIHDERAITLDISA